MKDALEQDLVLGNTYGFATCERGINDVVMGVLTGIGASRVSLGNVKRFCYVGNRRSGGSWRDSKTTSVYSFRLFPIPREVYEAADPGER